MSRDSAGGEQLDLILAGLRTPEPSDSAWSSLYDLMWPYVFTVAYRELRGDRTSAEDAAQEVFLGLVRSRPFTQLDSGRELRAYMAAMARNAARDRMTAVVIEALGEDDPLQGEEPSPEGIAAARERLSSVLGSLGAEERILVALLTRGVGYAEIGQALGISENAVAVRIHRLRERLRSGDDPHGGL